MVSNLDAGNNTLSVNFENIISEALTLDLGTYLPNMDAHLHAIGNDFTSLDDFLLEAKR